jgi:hypothetical protein
VPSEEKLSGQAKAALAAVRSGAMVESGVERVADGIHTEPDLPQGRTYRLDVVCVGTGTAQVTFTPASAGAKTTVPCDQSVVQRRITGRESLHIDVDGAKGATGVLAWVIGTVTPPATSASPTSRDESSRSRDAASTVSGRT